MFVRLKQATGGAEINLIAANILSFRPVEAGTEVQVVGGLCYSVAESCRTIRHQLSKLVTASQELEVAGAAG